MDRSKAGMTLYGLWFQTEPVDWDKLSAQLDTFRKECDIDLARRYLAGRNDAYPLLLDVLRASSGEADQMVPTSNALISLCCGQPDLLTPDGLELLCKYLQTYQGTDKPV